MAITGHDVVGLTLNSGLQYPVIQRICLNSVNLRFGNDQQSALAESDHECRTLVSGPRKAPADARPRQHILKLAEKWRGDNDIEGPTAPRLED